VNLNTTATVRSALATLLNSNRLTFFGVCLAITMRVCAILHIASVRPIHYTLRVEYPFPPVGIVGAADG
jgi:hypothetical protein